MILDAIRRLSAFAVPLALVLGLAVQGVKAAENRVGMMSAAVSSVSMPDQCDEHPVGKGMSSTGCLVPCTAGVAILPSVPAIHRRTVASAYTPIVRSPVDWDRPPDPLPPRSFVQI